MYKFFSNDIIIERNKTFYCSCSRSEHDKQWWFVWIHKIFGRTPVPYQTPWAQRTEQSPAWDSNNERRIINNCQKLQWIVFAKGNQLFLYRPFRSSFKTVHVFAEMAVYRRCKCLERIVIVWNWRSVFGKIKYTKLPEHLCLLNKLLQLVLVRILRWSCYMIGVILIFQSLCHSENRGVFSLIATGGRFARRKVCDSATEIPYWWCRICPESGHIISAYWISG